MYGKLVKILIGAVVVAILATILAVTAMKPQPTAEELLQQAKTNYPKRDLLHETTAGSATAPVIQQPPGVRLPVPTQQAQPAPAATPDPPVVTGQAPQRLELQLDRLAGTLKISSPVLSEGARIPLDHSCYRKNQSPPLAWTGKPRGTQSIVVMFDRIDPAEGDRLLWAVYNIPGAMTGLGAALPPAAALADGTAQAINDTGNTGYVGPCDPKGQVPYTLRVFALDTPLKLDGGLRRDDLVRAMNGHIIDMAVMNLVHHYRL